MLKFMIPTFFMMITKIKLNKMMMMMMVLLFNLSLQNESIQKLSYKMMGDQLSFWNVNLVLWLMFILFFINTKSMKFHMKIMMTSMVTFMMIFYSWNFLMFYILFEVSMIMMLIMLITWSYQPERTESIMFMIIMALIFSLPFLVMMFNTPKSLNFWFLNSNLSMWDYMSFMIIFMMKMPFYFIHFWLPKVHVEAPVQGSMILAAIMLKLGCYGLIRMMPVMMKFKKINITIISVGMWSIVLLSMTCFIQTDMKTLIAYSSIVHMSLILLSILINKSKSIMGSMIIMLSHGMTASALFFMSNIFYKITKSRSILLNKGVTKMLPMMTTMWFIGCMSNTPMPPAINIIGELILMKMIIEYTNMFMMIFMISLTSSLYSIFLFYTMMHGTSSKMMKMHFKMEMKTVLILVMHTVPLLFMSWKTKMAMIM